MKKNIFYGIGGLISGICSFVALGLTTVLFMAISCAWSLNPDKAGNESALNFISMAIAVVCVFAMLIGLIIGIRGFCGGRVALCFVVFEMFVHLAIVIASVYLVFPQNATSLNINISPLFFILFTIANVATLTLYVFGVLKNKKQSTLMEENKEEQPQEQTK